MQDLLSFRKPSKIALGFLDQEKGEVTKIATYLSQLFSRWNSRSAIASE
jgi:hypothetical protein